MQSYQNLTDEELMLLYQDEDDLAFRELYARYQLGVLNYLKKRLSGKDQLIEEIFQSAFMKLHRSKDKYDSKYKFRAWIFTILKSEMLDALKKKNLNSTPLDEQIHMIEQEERENIDLSETNLSLREKKVLELRFNEDQDFEQIAEVINSSATNTRKILSRAIKKLRAKL